MKADRVTTELVKILQSDSHRPIADIAQEVGCSTTACWRRIQSFRQSGVIMSTPTVLNRAKIGLPLTIFVQLKLERHAFANLGAFYSAIESHPEILECYAIFGSVDYILKVVAASIEDYERFFHSTISKLPAIIEANSSITMREVKNTHIVPIRQVPPSQVEKG